MRSLALCGTLILIAAACGSSERDASTRVHETVADALTRSVQFENGVHRAGDIARLDSAAASVALDASVARLQLAPGASSLLPFEVTTDTGDAPSAALVQFEGSDSHTEIPLDGDNSEPADAGSSSSDALHVENAFTVSGDVCEHLCNRVFQAKLLFAIELEGGATSRQASITVILDCTDDGDSELCDDAGAGSSSGGNGGIVVPGRDDGGSGPIGTADGGTPAAGDGGGGTPASDAGGPPPTTDGGPSGAAPPQLGLLTPETATAGVALTLDIMGQGFGADATAYLDGVALETTVLSDTELEAQIPASSVTAGSLLVYVENAPGDASSRSNVLYIQVAPAAGAPIIYDYSPDNGVAGDTILIIASNLAGQALTIEDEDGTELQAGTLGTISWPTAGTIDTVEVVLPDAITTGPITVSTPLGAYKGKIFSVGQNLTRAAGTVIEASSEYNTTNWGKASGADNNLATSYFTANYDCATNASCTTVPWFTITFADPQTVGRISMRGNREYASGYDFIRGTFEVLDGSGAALWAATYDLPSPDRDLDIVLATPLRNAGAVRFTSVEDESTEPGFAEIEVFAK